jgi:hypothetical protein
MAAHRKFTNEQRAAIYALHEQGVNGEEIARRCGHGLASVEPFDISPRTVRYIVARIAEERGAKPPENLADVERVLAEGRYTARGLRILGAELDRYERKIEAGKPLTRDDLTRFEYVLRLIERIEKRTARSVIQRPRKPSANGTPRESLAERLAREARTAAKGEREPKSELSHTHAPRENGNGSIPATDPEATKAARVEQALAKLKEEVEAEKRRQLERLRRS